MAVSTRTAVAAHALTFLAGREADGLQSSARIAESLESNPVLVRRVLGQLRAKGLVDAVEGSGGGWRLARPAAEISLLDAYAAVEDDLTLLPTHAHPPSRNCAVGRHMQSLLEEEFCAARRAMEEQLAGTTIADMHRRIQRRDGAAPVSG
ncbi:Rrf2 family transcriptional regulator [Streptomyces boninensis]|uniref:Rrf2 family transcriptional regulator n=1 Tax=Streptomyces boninensis TaxID=2039455 RepID=UPI003B211277